MLPLAAMLFGLLIGWIMARRGYMRRNRPEATEDTSAPDGAG
jgi:hypothetical protein